MPIIIRNKNYKSPRIKDLEIEAAKIKTYFENNPDTEQLTKAELVTAIPSLAALAPLEDGEIHHMCDLAEVDFIRT